MPLCRDAPTTSLLSCERRSSLCRFSHSLRSSLRSSAHGVRKSTALAANWIYCEINMIKLLTYSLSLCFLLSFKKILPSWTTSRGHGGGQCRSDCCDNAAEEPRHNHCGLSNAARLLVHVLKPHPAHLLCSSPPINYTLYCAALLLQPLWVAQTPGGLVLPLLHRNILAVYSQTGQFIPFWTRFVFYWW